MTYCILDNLRTYRLSVQFELKKSREFDIIDTTMTNLFFNSFDGKIRKTSDLKCMSGCVSEECRDICSLYDSPYVWLRSCRDQTTATKFYINNSVCIVNLRSIRMMHDSVAVDALTVGYFGLVNVMCSI